MLKKLRIPLAAAVLATAVLGGCQSMPHEPIPTVAQVDLPRFMGDWYVIASIPTSIEKNAYNAVESYALNPDGTIATTFTFREGGFDGKQRTYHPKGFVSKEGSNAIWGMQFVWPIRAEYLIVSLDAGYSQTVIARNKRDYVWIMARTPSLPETEYARLIDQIGKWGYDTAKLRRVPQRW
jgi:apolipoprotein D and lipocalin family protein